VDAEDAAGGPLLLQVQLLPHDLLVVLHVLGPEVDLFAE
jgi:hypothetical protein